VLVRSGTVEHPQPPPWTTKGSTSGSQVLVVGLHTGSAAGQSVLLPHSTHFRVAGLHTGAVPGQSELFVQSLPQVPVAGLQIGFGGAHWVLSVHWMHFFVVGLQIGAVPGHSELFVQSLPQVPVVGLQIGLGGAHWVLSVHWTHFRVVGLQIGAVPGHSELFVQSLPQVPVAVLQIGVDAGHCELSVHWTQRLVAGLQTGAVPGHSSLFAHSALQVWVVGLQTGVSNGQSAPVRQTMQTFVASLQKGFGATHLAGLAVVHSTQMPSGSLQTGAELEQFASEAQPVVQTWVLVSHFPLAPVHSLFPLHWTQRFCATSQTGFAEVQALTFAAEHSTHVPAPGPARRQAGAATVAHAALAFEPRSPLQATQVPAALQIGFAPEHWLLLVHSTQVWLVVLQAGVGGRQRVTFAAEHWTHRPASAPLVRQAGAVPSRQAFEAPLPKSPLQGTHAPPEQRGFAPEHWAFTTHSTQVFDVVSHWGVEPLQSVKSRHWTHADEIVLQRGVGELQLASDEQPGPQVFVTRLQMPLPPTHCAFERHWTHWWVASLQIGSPGVQALTLVPGGGPAPSLHSKHEPPAQAGRRAVGQARTVGGAPALSLSALHAAHVLVAVLQTGRGPVATQFPLVVHSTQTFVWLLQTGVAPVHCVALPALHWTQAPVAMLQAGAAELGHGLELALP
jgi:hypothetical protein